MTFAITNHVAKFEIEKVADDKYRIIAIYQNGDRAMWDRNNIDTERGAKAKLTFYRNKYQKRYGVTVE